MPEFKPIQLSFSKIIILFSLSALQSLVFILIANSMLEIRGMILPYWAILFTASCWANLVGLIISSGLNSVVTIYILVPIILVPELLFSGVVVDFDKMHNKITSFKHVPLIGEIMTSRWAYEAIMVTQFKDNKFEKAFYSSEKKLKSAIYYRSYSIPEIKSLAYQSQNLINKSDTTKLWGKLEIIRKEVSEIGNELGWRTDQLERELTVKQYNDSVLARLENFSFYLRKEKFY
ncbi:MAG: ABC transporter permease [Bacteroidales bacterium]|nr:ABC transporter permease [Bacteroidales bacterium]